MPMQIEEDPETPGLIYATDPETGLRRPAWDPSGALRASILGRVEPAAPPPEYVPEPAAPVSVQGALRAEGPPPPPAAPPPGAPPPAPAPEDWQAAQNPRPAPVVRASGLPPPAPPAPGGTVLSKAKVTPGTPGYQYDKVAEEQRGEDLLERTSEQQRRADLLDAVMNEQQIELQKQQAEAQKQQRITQEKSTRYERELTETVGKAINPERIQQNRGVMGSILGIIGQELAEFARPGAASQIEASLQARIERDIQAQREQKDSAISMLTRQLGSAQQAEAHYRAAVTALASNVLENRVQRLGLQNEFADRIQALRDQAMQYNEAAKAASFGKPGQAEYEYALPKPEKGAGAVAPSDATTQALKQLGITPEAYQKGLNAKTEFGTTVAQAGNAVKHIDADILEIKALMAENGGELQGKELVQLPERLVPWAAQLGIESGMSRERVNQILMANLETRARQIFGAQPPAGFQQMIAKEQGASTTALLHWMQRMRDQGNDAVRAELPVYWGSNAQKAYELYLGDVGGTRALPQPNPPPLGVRNAPPAPEQPRELSDIEQKQAENRKRLRERATGLFEGAFGNPIEQSPVPLPRYGSKF